MASIDAVIGLAVDDRTRHWTYFQKERSESSRHKSDYGGGHVTVTQPIYNGRGMALSLDEASFELIDVPTSLATDDFYRLKDNAELERRYFAEVEAVVKKKLGCDKIVFIHHQVRNASKTNIPGVAGYAGGGPHTDSSGVSGDELAMGLLKREADTTRYKRYLYVNLWRNISEDPIENDHLAVLDERTTAKPDDYIPKDLFGPGYSVVQYSLNARHAKHHKWYYFPSMKKSEGILFKQIDSDVTLTGRTCFHMSVTDPTASADAKPRESIELRMVCYWKEAMVDSMPTEENMNLHLKQDPEKLALENAPPNSKSFWSIFSWFPFCTSREKTPDAYTGKPEDYIPRVTQAIEYYPHWPEQAKQWVQLLIRTSGEERAIQEITQKIVKDEGNHQGLKQFTAEQHHEILSALLADANYMAEARKQLLKSK